MNDILVKVGADISQFSRAMSESTKTLQNFSNTNQETFSSFGKVGNALTNSITKPAAIATTAAVGLTSALGFKRLVGMDSAQAKLKGLGYNAKEVESISGHVENAIEGGMTTMAEGIDIAAGAMAAGVEEGAELEKYVRLVGDAAIGANRPVDEMAQIFNRVQGGGRLMTQELNQIEHGMPGFSQALAKHLGVAPEKMREMVTAGEVSSQDFLNVMDNFAGGMAEAYSDSWAGMVQNTWAYVGQIGEALLDGLFKDGKKAMSNFISLLESGEIQDWARNTGETIRDIVRGWTESIAELKSWYDNLSPSVQKTVQVLALFGSIGLIALGPVLKMIGAIPALIEGFTSVTTVVKGVAGVFTSLSAPMIATIAVIGLVVAAIVNLWRTNEEFRANVVTIWTNIMTLITSVWQAIQPGAMAFVAILGVLIGVMSELIGWVVGVVASITTWIVSFIEANQWIMQTIQVIGIIIGVIAGLVAAFMVVAKIIAIVIAVVKVVAAVFLFFTSPVGIVIAIIGALVAAIMWLGEKFEWIGNVVDAVADFMSNAWNKFLGFFGGGTSEAADEAESAIEGVSESGKENLDDLATSGTESSQELSEGVSTNIGAMADASTEEVSGMSTDMLSSFEELSGGGSEAVSGMSEDVMSEIGDMSDFSIEDMQNLEIGGIDAMSGLDDGVTSEVKGMTGEVKSDVSDMESSASGDFSGLTSEMSSNAKKVRGEVSKAFSGMAKDINSEMISISKMANTGMMAVSLSISKGMSMATKTIRASMQAMSREVAKSFSLIIKTVQASFVAMNTQTSRGSDKMNNTIAQANSLTIKSYRASFNAVSNAISGGMDRAVSTIQTKNKFIVAHVRSLNGQLYSAGIHAMSGFRNGLNAGSSSVLATARSIASKAAAAMKGALKVKSPSRVTADIGKWASLGLADGMMSYARQVERSADRLAVAAVPDIDMRYNTPSGIHRTMSSAINGSVDVNNRDEMLANAINELRRDMTDLRVDMDGEKVGRIVRPHVNNGNAVDAVVRRYFD